VLAVCIGGWMMLVKPKIDEVANLEGILAEHATFASSAINQQSIEAGAKRVAAMKTRLEQIESFNQLAGDSSRFYGLVMDLADAHGVQVQSLQPGSVKQSSEEKQVESTRINLTVEGTYEKIAMFLDGICNLDAFVRPQALQVSPARASNGNAQTVEATFGCDVMSFAIAGSLNDMGAQVHAMP
jgi:Tfp pilus assembly protein PilO